MDAVTVALYIVAGVGGGIVSATVGGGSLVTYPVLLASGVPPLPAAIITNTSLVPSNFVAALADRGQLPPLDRAFLGLVLASIGGSAAGALLLLATPERTFALIVPLLLAFATALFALSGRISDWLKARAAQRNRTHEIRATSFRLLFPVSFYGGYFGSGVGILLMAVLSIATGGNYRAANVVKNLVGSLGSLAASAIYVVQGAVWWPQTVTLTVGTVAGGLAGSWLARILPRALARVLVTLCGCALTAGCIYRYWL